MAPAEFFSKFGVYVQPNFLTEAECRQIREEMRAAPGEAARVGRRGKEIQGPVEGVVAPELRRGSVVSMPPATQAGIAQRLRGLRVRAAAFFDMPLSDRIEAPKFLIYRHGDFFSPHTDRRHAEEPGAAISKARRVNLVLYLNGESDMPGPEVYAGGCLTLYHLIPASSWRPIGFPITGEPGLLIGFPSQLLHEVTPILHGERFNIVSRFLDAETPAEAQPDSTPAAL